MSLAWDAATDDRIARLDQIEAALPPTPFRLRIHVLVIDVPGFFAGLRKDIGKGPSGPAARFGALQADLAALDAISACHTVLQITGRDQATILETSTLPRLIK